MELADSIKCEKVSWCCCIYMLCCRPILPFQFIVLQDKFEAAIAKYRSEVKKYRKSCHQLEEQLKAKDIELATREQEMMRAKAASDQLSNAFISFQRVGL